MIGGRGRTGSAIGTAAKKSFGLEASVANILVNPRSEWISYAHNGVRTAAKDIDWQKFNKDDYLLTQCTIVCSVETEDDGHTIIPACNNLVNANGNAWTNDILLATFRSFVGAQNYLEHCFPAGTKVLMADRSYKNIDDVVVGESVINAKGKADVVADTMCRESDVFVKVNCPFLDSGKPFVFATPEHPFLVSDFEGVTRFVKAEDLDASTMYLVTPSGVGFGTLFKTKDGDNAHLFSVEKGIQFKHKVKVYNLTVRDDNTYVVEGIAVHNCQIPALSKGTILDAVIRPVEHTGENGEKAHIYYVDILVATSREHKDLVEKIESGRLTTLSMGATCEYVTCSKCGGVFTDDDSCEHIKNEIGQKYFDEQGKERIVSELCGRMVEKDGKLVADPDSVTFIEASWVEHPAFKGAVLEQYIEGVPASTKSKHASYMELTDAMEDIFKLRVADEKSGLILKVAQDEARRIERENRIARLTNEISR